jgi:hypothetical protein
MPRYGKIHSMPGTLQDAASELIQTGKTEQQVAEWLNETLSQAKIKGLEADVNQQNVSAWKKSGYKRWQERNRARDLAKRITEIKESADPTKADAADNLAAALTAELAIELAYVKENYEPGEQRAKRLLGIIAGLISLRRTNQAKGWLKIEVAKTKMSMTRLQHETGARDESLEDDTQRGVTEETMQRLMDEIMGEDIPEDAEYPLLSKEDHEKILDQAHEAMKKL